MYKAMQMGRITDWHYLKHSVLRKYQRKNQNAWFEMRDDPWRNSTEDRF